MRVRHCLISMPLLFAAPAEVRAGAADPQALFNEAVRDELSRDGDVARAFQLYRRAADAGLPAAQFNVGAMLDSGRGTPKDAAQAATWYARAAAHGDQRSAYNLGQLYEAGQGVPRNPDLARAWFAASDLPAARGRPVMDRAGGAAPRAMSPPLSVSPAPGSRLQRGGDVELVWTAAPQPEPVRFFVELRALDEAGTREVFSGFRDTTSVLAPLGEAPGTYMWRVFAVARRAGTYLPGEWSRFTVAPAR